MYQGTFDPISNRADWFGTLQLVNADTGDIITDLTGVDVTLVVRKDRCGPYLTATLDNAKFDDLGGGVLQWHFTASDMGTICPDTYQIGITVKRDGIVEQEVIGILPIIDGIVGR
jgi:hypothetical protein